MIKISVIIPVYNSQRYIEKCLKSLLKQNYSDWEAICIDDGSIDSSAEILDTYSQKYDHIKVIHIANGGVSNARNIGIRNASGKYVMFLDSDDYLEKDALVKLDAYLNDDPYDVVCFALKTDSSAKSDYFPMSSPFTSVKDAHCREMYDLQLRTFTGWSMNNKKDYCMHFAVTKLIRRELIIQNNLLFDTSLKYHEDTLFSNQVIQNATSVCAVNDYYYVRTIHKGSASVSYCDTIVDCNMKCLERFRNFIQIYHPDDPLFERAYVKYQLAWFVQCLKLDVMNEKAKYSKRQRIEKIDQILNLDCFQPHSSFKNLKFAHKILYIMMKLKLKRVIYYSFAMKFV